MKGTATRLISISPLLLDVKGTVSVCSERNDNSLISSQEELENHITSYFSQVFSSRNLMVEEINKITSLVHYGVTQTMNNYFDTPFSEEEVKKAMFDLHPSKAPGLDGFIALFFQNA